MPEQGQSQAWKYSKIAIIGYFEFPSGSAGASRIRNLARGLLNAGASVTVITQTPGQGQNGQENPPFFFKDIPYYLTHPAQESKPGPFSKLRGFSTSIWRSTALLKSLITSKQVDAVIVYTLGFLSAWPILKLCKQYKVPVITDVVEWVVPEIFRGQQLNPHYWHKYLKRRFLDREFTGALVISRFLEEQYQKNEYPVLRIPALYDFENSPYPGQTEAPPQTYLKLAFVGGNKPNDGLEDLIEALNFNNPGRAVRLIIIGPIAPGSYLAKIRERVNREPGLREKVTFAGKLSEKDYTASLAGSDVLVMTRRDNLMARAAFPTRLPELLATGRPVITTCVPDVPEYLTDQEDAFVVEPARPDLIAGKIDLILQDRQLANKVGKSGQSKARKYFDCNQYGPRLLEFIRDLENV